MTDKHPKRPRDPNQLAKSIVDLATGEQPDKKQPSRLALKSSEGGKIGGKSRAEILSPERRQDIARKAAQTRWKNQAPAAQEKKEHQ
ncbi:histone H1 [Mesorhizobium sp. SARCC-RB16n]|nr:histone H1 [Mesorhizobium sp. SARCC-RB16n]